MKMEGRTTGTIDSKERMGMFLVLILTIIFLGFFYGKVYLDTPEFFQIWGRNFAWHAVVPYFGTAAVGFVLLLLGLQAKKS